MIINRIFKPARGQYQLPDNKINKGVQKELQVSLRMPCLPAGNLYFLIISRLLHSPDSHRDRSQ
jgi:hypothetical protein